MLKTNYKYYLANGECIEYSLSPDSSILNIIDKLIADYFKVRHWRHWNDCVLVRPDIAAALYKELANSRTFGAVSSTGFPGLKVVKFETPYGPMTIIVEPSLHLPVFLGSEQELKDNAFDATMEEILCA
jgi:hypothetical protein